MPESANDTLRQTVDSLSAAVSAWQKAAPADLFRQAVAQILAWAQDASHQKDATVARDTFNQLSQLAACEALLRPKGLIGWAQLCELAEARFIAGCLLAPASAEEAYRMLFEQTVWCKQVLSDQPLGPESDYDHALRFVHIAQLSWLAAHRYVKPEPRHAADRVIPEEFSRVLTRILKNAQLEQQIHSSLAAASK